MHTAGKGLNRATNAILRAWRWEWPTGAALICIGAYIAWLIAGAVIRHFFSLRWWLGQAEWIGILVVLVALLWAGGEIHERWRWPERLVATLRWAVAVALLGTIVYGIGYLLWSPHRTLRLLSDFFQWAIIAVLLAGTPIAFWLLMDRRRKAALRLALVLAFLILIWLLRTWTEYPFRHSETRPTAEESAAVQAILNPKVLQRLRARDVKESGPDMKSTYSGFVDNGRAFAATQNGDEGSCMVTTPEQAQWERREFHVKGTVEPIFLIQYDDGRGGSFWEISQNARAGDINFLPPTTGDAVVEEACQVSVIFH